MCFHDFMLFFFSRKITRVWYIRFGVRGIGFLYWEVASLNAILKEHEFLILNDSCLCIKKKKTILV